MGGRRPCLEEGGLQAQGELLLPPRGSEQSKVRNIHHQSPENAYHFAEQHPCLAGAVPEIEVGSVEANAEVVASQLRVCTVSRVDAEYRPGSLRTDDPMHPRHLLEIRRQLCMEFKW